MFGDAVRSLRAARGVTLFILFILTLTISVATVTFSVVDAVVLRSLPFHTPGELAVIEYDRGDGVMQHARSLSPFKFLALKDQAGGVAAVAAVSRGSRAMPSNGEAVRIPSAAVTASLFDVLGVRPLLGQTFSAAHEVAGNDRVAVISHALWRARFGGDTGIVGRTLQMSDGPLLVLGVMPQGFSYPISDDRVPDLWTPYVIPDDERIRDESSYLHVVARLAAGTSIGQAQAMAESVRAGLDQAHPARYERGRFVVTPLDEAVVGPTRGWMLLVLFAVGVLVLVACANVGNLLLTRALQRERELSIRASLGATRARLVGSLLIESLILSLTAVSLSLVLASWGIEAVQAALPPGIARAHLIALDLRVFAVAVVAASVTGLLFGAFPALQGARVDLATSLKGGATVTSGGNRWRSSVLVAEIAFASVLLVATTLFVSSFIRLTRADLGFDRSNLLVVTSVSGLEGTVSDLTARLEALPGVAAVGGAAAGSPPLVAAGFGGGSSATRLQLPDAAPGAAPVTADFNRVTPGYLAAARIPILKGQGFGDAGASAQTVVLDDLAARQLFGEQDPIGREVVYGNKTRATVIGVASNVQMRGPEAPSSPQAYFPGPATARSYSYLVRTTAPASTVVPALQGAIASLRPEGSRPAEIRPVEGAFRNITARRRFSAGLMALFGALALLIGAAGVYGVVSSSVAQRTREIGLRQALGATRAQIAGAVLGQIGRQLAVGLTLGLLVAWFVSRGFAALFFEVRPTDAWVYALVAAVLMVVGVAAALVPARRASRVDPLVALRVE